MEKVWIILIDYEQGMGHIEGVFDSFEVASIAAHGLLKDFNKAFNEHVWERQAVTTGDEETIIFYRTNIITHKDSFYATIRVKSYPVWH